MARRRQGKWVGGAVASVVVVSALTPTQVALAAGLSRNRQAPSYAGQTLTVLVGAPSGSNAGQTRALYSDWARALHNETGATVQYVYPTNANSEITDIQAATVTGNGPDVVQYGSSFVGTLMATGDFPVLTKQNWQELGGRASFIPSMLQDSGTGPSDDIGVPYEDNAYVMAYNTNYFMRAGIASPPTTWTQFVNDAELIQKKIPGVYGTAINPEGDIVGWKSVWLLNKMYGGGHWVMPGGRKVNIDSAGDVNAFDFYYGLDYRFHIVPPQSVTWGSAQTFDSFASGQIAMVPAASVGYISGLAGSFVEGHVGFAPIPAIPYGYSALPKGGVDAETTLASNYFAIPGYVKSKELLALDFVKLVTSQAMQLRQYQLVGQIPVTIKAASIVAARYKVAAPFIASSRHSVPTSTAPLWNYVGPGVTVVMHNVAARLATSGSWSQSYLLSQLKNAQLVAQVHA